MRTDVQCPLTLIVMELATLHYAWYIQGESKSLQNFAVDEYSKCHPTQLCVELLIAKNNEPQIQMHLITPNQLDVH